MAAFEYTALDEQGKRQQGVMQGDSARQVRQQMRDAGLAPLHVDASETASPNAGNSRLQRTTLSATDLSLLTRQLATLVRAGLPLDDVLQALSEQVEELKIKRIILAIRSKIMEGHSLSEGMEQFPKVFPDLYRATVSAGEHSRDLANVLERLADYSEQHHAMLQKIRIAMLYPAVLSFTALLVTVGLLGFVVPEVVSVFEQSEQQLPTITLALIAISETIQSSWHWMLLTVIAGSIGIKRALKNDDIRFKQHQILLKLPLIRNLIKENNAARFSRTLSILLGSGVPLVESLKIACRALTNLVIKKAIDQASARIQEGESMTQALKKGSHLPPLTIHLIANGEAAGTLESMLDSAANTHDRNLQSRINAFLGILEPLLILLMGGIVLLIVIAILLPIFELNQLV